MWSRNYTGAAPWSEPGWCVMPLRGPEFDLSELFRLEAPRIETGLFGGWTSLIIPYWLHLCLAAAATGLLFWRGRPFGAGKCRSCGYDLTGNVSGPRWRASGSRWRSSRRRLR